MWRQLCPRARHKLKSLILVLNLPLLSSLLTSLLCQLIMRTEKFPEILSSGITLKRERAWKVDILVEGGWGALGFIVSCCFLFCGGPFHLSQPTFLHIPGIPQTKRGERVRNWPWLCLSTADLCDRNSKEFYTHMWMTQDTRILKTRWAQVHAKKEKAHIVCHLNFHFTETFTDM